MLHLFQVGLVASGLAAAVVSAQDLLPFPLQHPQLQPRQYFSEAPTSIASQCLVAFSSLASSVPTPPADLGSWLSDFMFTARPGCYASYPLPATLTSEFSAYSTSVQSWVSTHTADIDNLSSICPDQLQLRTSRTCTTTYSGTEIEGSWTSPPTQTASTPTPTTAAAGATSPPKNGAGGDRPGLVGAVLAGGLVAVALM